MFKPLNRHLLIKPQPVDERKTAVLLPEDFKEEKGRYSIVQLLATADDCKPELAALDPPWLPPKSVLVQTDMIEVVNIGSEIFHFVLENYVLGIIEK